jgi:hypothetical protein
VNGITFVGRKPGSEGTLIVDGEGSLFLGGAVVHVGKDFDFETFQAIEPGGDGSVVESNGGVILGSIEISQVTSAASTDALLSALGRSNDTGDELEEEPGLEETAENESESEDSSSDSLLECR